MAITITIAILIDHSALIKYLKRIGIRDGTDCENNDSAEESAADALICDGTAQVPSDAHRHHQREIYNKESLPTIARIVTFVCKRLKYSTYDATAKTCFALEILLFSLLNFIFNNTRTTRIPHKPQSFLQFSHLMQMKLVKWVFDF